MGFQQLAQFPAIARFQAFEHFRMLGHRLVPALGREVGTVAGGEDAGIQALEGFRQHRVPGCGADTGVNAHVGAEIARQVAPGVTCQHVELQCTNLGEFGLGYVLRGQLTGQTLKCCDYREGGFDVFQHQARHHRAAVLLQFDQAGTSQKLEGFAQRRA